MTNSSRQRFLNWLYQDHSKLYWKLSRGFIVIMLLVLSGELYFTFTTWRETVQDVEQKLYWDVASEIANRIVQQTGDDLDYHKIRRILHETETLNPQLETYLIDDDGFVLVSMARFSFGEKKRIDLGKIRNALQIPTPKFPMLGPDPSLSNKSDNIFSVSELKIGSDTVYVYVIIQSHIYRKLFETTGQFYVIKRALIGSILMILAGIVIGLILFKQLTINLEQLAAVVRKFSNNDFSTRVKVVGKDEISQLATSINSMADTIVSTSEELRQQDELRRTLIANISHDLRGPMTSALGLVELLEKNDQSYDSEERRRLLEILRKSLKTEYQLAEDLFELSKLEAQARPPAIEAFSISELINDIAAVQKMAAESKNITLSFDPPTGLPEVMADPVLIARVLTNLLSNAIRYSDDGGRITVSVTQQGQKLLIAVEDTGIGIAPEQLPFLFDSFYRAHRDCAPKREGTGLGLAIVKRIIEMHEEEIRVESEIDAGSRFVFSLAIADVEYES